MGATDRPYFRTDLVSRPIEDAGHRFIEVTDPDSGHSFRFYEIEYAIACAMDGERDVDGLADWARIELGLDPSSDELRTVISTLGELGYLEGTVPRVAERPAEPPPLDRPPPAGRTAVPPGPPLGPSPFDFGMDAPIATPVSARAPGDLPPDLSTDLSQHSPVRAADVQEAVRQSRAMPAARPPDSAAADDDDAFDEQQTPVPMGGPLRAPAAAAAGADPFSAAHRQPPPTPPPAQLSPSLQKTLMGTGPAGGFGVRTPTPPMVLPEQPSDFNPSDFNRAAAVLGGAPAHPTAPARPAAMGRDARESHQAPPHQSVSAEMPMFTAKRPTALLPYLIVLLLLTAAGAVAYWWFFMYQPGDGEGAETVNESPPVAQSAVEPSRPAAAQPVPPAPEPVEVVATLEAGPAREQEVLSPRAGRVAWVAPSGGEVAEGAAVAKFDGFPAAEYAVKEAQDSQRNYQEKLDQATARGDKEAMKTAEGNVKRKQRDIDRRTAELDELLIKAPVGGVVEPSIKPRSSVTKDQPVAKILAPSEPRATFALPPGQTHAAPQVQVNSKSDPTLRATCKVEASEPGKLVVVCPTDSGLASGTQLVLTPQ